MLTSEFQIQLLRYFAQDPRGFSIVENVPLSTFDLGEHQVVVNLLQLFRKRSKKGGLPSKIALHQLFHEQENVPDEMKGMLLDSITDAFEPIDAGLEMYHTKAIDLVQKKLCYDLLANTAPSLSGLSDAPAFNLDKIFGQMRRIVNLDVSSDIRRPLSFLYDTIDNVELPTIYPTYLQGLNDLTSAGGFHTPQLVILMGGPKGFKTGVGLNIAYGYLVDGLKVYIPDFENGEVDLYERMIQRMVYCTDQEVRNMRSIIREPQNITLQEIYESINKFLRRVGGDIRFSKFQAFEHGTNEVKAQLDWLANEEDFVPNFTMWDYADIMAPADKSIKEERLRTRAIYHEIISVNTIYNMFSLSFSAISKEAVNKPVIDLKAFAEDFKKAYNCHAAFALCRTEDELLNNTGRLVSVVQRKGTRFDGSNEVYLSIDEAHQRCTEIDPLDTSIQDE